ncbi:MULTISPECIES: hypothetical protein [Acidithiobacillus]|jgi:hypothetical protein|nr:MULTISPECIES: hypothetical protein [Acidithiobacillus]MBU2740577.1 hypothetical protein [Acidithiobacillus albertensis]MBU2835483.1 hypothetical protein [Acidithiobacillus thiooxidans]
MKSTSARLNILYGERPCLVPSNDKQLHGMSGAIGAMLESGVRARYNWLE